MLDCWLPFTGGFVDAPCGDFDYSLIVAAHLGVHHHLTWTGEQSHLISKNLKHNTCEHKETKKITSKTSNQRRTSVFILASWAS